MIKVELWKKYILSEGNSQKKWKPKKSSKITEAEFDIVYEVLQSRYRAYMATDNQNRLSEFLTLDQWSRNYKRSLIESFKTKFKNIRLCFFKISNEQQKNWETKVTQEKLICINTEDIDEIMWDYLKELSKLPVWKPHTLKFKNSHLFQNFFSTTMKGIRVTILWVEYLLIVDKWPKKEENFDEFDFLYISSMIEKFILYVDLNLKNKKNQAEGSESWNSSVVVRNS